MFKDEVSGLMVRDKADIGVIKQQKDYKELIALGCKQDIILDLGGYIGTFAWFAAKHLSPRQVISVEPDPSNIAVYKQNFPLNTLYEAAVTRTGGEKLPLYLGKTYRSCNSLESFRGREHIDVPTVGFEELLEKHLPTLIKCDIEGGEFKLPWTDLPPSVHTIAMEIHQAREEWLQGAVDIDTVLQEQGFKPVHPLKHKVTFHKVDIGIWSRK